MPDLYNPIDEQPWPAERFYRDAPLWAPSGVVGSPQSGYGAGPLALSFSVAGSVITPALAVGRARARGMLYERTSTPWTSGMAGTQPTPGSAAYALNSNSNPRRDRLVLRRDLAAAKAYPLIRIGTPAASPSAPALTQDEAGVWDTPLFSWQLAGGSSTAISNIADERVWLDPDGQGVWPQWVDLPLWTANWRPYTESNTYTQTIQYRVEGRRVFLRGYVECYASSPALGQISGLNVVPAALRPSATVPLWAPVELSVPIRLEITADGTLRTYRAINAGIFFDLDGLSWAI